MLKSFTTLAIAGARSVGSRRVCAAALVSGVLLAGCKNGPLAQQGAGMGPAAEELALDPRVEELETRAGTLDDDNQELSTLLAQSQQENRLLTDQVTALRQQLGDTASQLARLREEFDDTSQRTNALAASLRKRAGAAITANTSFRRELPTFSMQGIEVRQDGDVIRVELPGNRLFAPGSARLLPDAAGLIEGVATEVMRIYPRQKLGIEGHTDSDPIQSSQWANNQQLSVGRAMAVYDHLLARTSIEPNQLFVVGHGANHPIVSNATPEGKERNRRVELVIYPEQLTP